MARPTARVLALLEILQNGGTRTVADLAARLEVDERTVRRYVEHLRELDLPVESVRGRHGGYRLMPGYRMPPLMLTDEEALATVTGLQAGRRTGVVAGSAAAVASAEAKIRRVLPRRLAERLAALLEVVDITTTGPGSATTPQVDVLLTVAEAARDRRVVLLTHTGRDGRTTERSVAPGGVVAHHGRWYLVGTDASSGETRTFRLDRVSEVRTAEQTFDEPPVVDPAAQVLDALARTPWRHEVSVRVQAPPDRVLQRLAAGIARVEPVAGEPGWVRVLVRAERLDWVPGELVRIDAPFVLERPEELRRLLRELAARLTAGAEEPPGQTAAPGTEVPGAAR